MKSFEVVRTHTSPYQSKTFRELEKTSLEAMGFEYRDLETASLTKPTILITNTHTQLISLPKKILDVTELIIHPNSGYDHFKDEFDLWKNIPVIIGHEVRAQAVAEYSLSCLFQGMCDLPRHMVWDKNRNWDRPLIRDQVVMVVGLGHIGMIVAQTLKSLGVQVLSVDPYVLNSDFKSLAQAPVEKADAMIVCASLNPSSHNLFNQNFFKRPKKNLIFINGARGKLFDPEALKEFLLLNPEAQAFLDVFPHEPFTEEWINFPQTWKTSHIAGVTRDLDQKILDFEIKILEDYIKLDEMGFSQKYFSELLQNKWKQGVLI